MQMNGDEEREREKDFDQWHHALNGEQVDMNERERVRHFRSLGYSATPIIFIRLITMRKCNIQSFDRRDEEVEEQGVVDILIHQYFTRRHQEISIYLSQHPVSR